MRTLAGLTLLVAGGWALLCGPQMARAQCGSRIITSCPDDIMVPACDQGGGVVGAVVDYPLPTANDDCGPVELFLAQGFPPGSLFPEGETLVEWRSGLDENGSYTSCFFRVTTEWHRVQTFCPEDIVVPACDQGGGVIGAVVDYPVPTLADDCGPLELFLAQGLPPGSVFPEGETLIEWRSALDSNGSYISCYFRVTAEWNRRITSCPEDITVYSCDPGGAIVDYAVPTAADDCGPIPLFLFGGVKAGGLFPVGTTSVEWITGFDAQGSYIGCFFAVTVLPGDVEPPSLTCPGEVTAIAEPGEAATVVEYEIQATDNCPGDVTVVCVPPSGTNFPCGTTVVTCTATDEAGNPSTCSFPVTVSVPVPVDVRPGSCPNPLKTSEQGVVPVAVLGGPLFDPAEVDPATVRLEGVPPLRWTMEDAGTPFAPILGKSDCLDCNKLKRDGIQDLSLKFGAAELVAALGPVSHGECRVVRLTGTTFDGCPIVGEDVVKILAASEALQPAAWVPAPGAYVLSPNHPNPFSPETRIGFSMPVAGQARLVVYDVSGREVKVVLDRTQSAGSYTEVWDGRDRNGSRVPGGVYFYRLTVVPVEGTGAPFQEQRKMILSR